MKIIFDPSKNRQVFLSFFETYLTYQINTLSDPILSGAYMYGITLEDFYSWKQAKQVWDDLILSSSTEINDWVRVVNDISERTYIQVRASLTTPLLVNEPIDFGVTKVDSRSFKDITIENPSDAPIYVQLFLGPEEFSNLNFISQLFKTETG